MVVKDHLHSSSDVQDVISSTVLLVQSSRECTPPDLSTEISNLLQPAQAEVV
jgi:hypothetical protein